MKGSFKIRIVTSSATLDAASAQLKLREKLLEEFVIRLMVKNRLYNILVFKKIWFVLSFINKIFLES